MLNNLIAWSLRNRVVVLAVAGLMLIAGVWTASRMPVDVFPDLTAPTVTVLTEAHGMAPEEVEALVSFPIETAVNGATGVRRVRSSTAQGISVVWVEFDWGTDIFRARQTVAEKLQAVASSLPTGIAAPVLAPVSSVMGEIMMIGLTGTQSPTDLRTTADWTIRRRLLAVPGVAQVIPIGGAVKQYQVLADPGRMLAAGVSLREVVAAAKGSNENASGGVFMDKGQEYVIRGIGRVQTPADIAGSVVAVRNGVPITIGQVADVVVGPAPSYGDGSVNAKPGVVLAVQKQPGANTLELTERIEDELEAIQATLPKGMQIRADLFRQADFISVAVSNVLKALRDGAILVVIILFLFLWNFRTTAISIIAIPLSLVVAIFAMKALGITINTMTLGGMAIAIGALVDDAIIDVENVFRRLKENHHLPEGERRPALQVVYDASREIRASIVNATLIIIVVFLPLFFLGGVEGRLLRPLGFAYVVAILASLLVAVTVTPVLCAYLLPNAKAVVTEHESALVHWLKTHYHRILESSLAHPRRVLAGAAIALVAAVAAIPFLGTAFLPEFNEGALTVSVVTIPGTSLEESNAIGRRVEEILLADPAVENTDRRQGRAELDEHAQGVNAAEIDVTLKKDIDKERVFERLREQFSAIPGTNVTIGQPIGHRIDHMLSGTRANIAVKVFGPDLYRLRQVGTEIRDVMQNVPGVADLQLEQQMDVPQLRIRADRVALARYGMTVGDLAEAIDVAGARGRPQLRSRRAFSPGPSFHAGGHRGRGVRHADGADCRAVTARRGRSRSRTEHRVARKRAAKDRRPSKRRRPRPRQHGGRHQGSRRRARHVAGGILRGIRRTVRGAGGIDAHAGGALGVGGRGDLSDSLYGVSLDPHIGPRYDESSARGRRWHCGGAAHRRGSEHRVARRVRDVVRHRDAQRHPSGRALPAVARRGRRVSRGDRARVFGATFANSHDGAHGRAGAHSARHRRRRARKRAPDADGDRDSRRSALRHGAQHARAARVVFAVRRSASRSGPGERRGFIPRRDAKSHPSLSLMRILL
jgi:CzcA family heavy metal efflux pump